MNPACWSAEAVEDWLVARVAGSTGASPQAIDVEAPFTSLQVDSVGLLELLVGLEDAVGMEIEATIAYDYPTIRLLASQVASALAARI